MNDTQLYRKNVLRAVTLTKRFGELAAVGGVDFEVPRHSIVSLIGPNGAGKTVLFNMLTGLIKPDGGEVWFNGERITGLTPDRITTMGIARTFQGIRLFKNMTVLENVVVGRHSRMKQGILDAVLRHSGQKNEEKDAYRASLEMLDFVGLRHLADAGAKDLPYGIQRRVEVA